MAIRKTVDFHGLIVPDAYIRIELLTIYPGNTRMEFGVHIMVSPTSIPFEIYTVGSQYNLEGGNPIRQGYDHLKTLDRFLGSEDC